MIHKKIRHTIVILGVSILALTLGYFTSKTQFSNAEWLGVENQTEANKRYLYKEFEKGENLIVAIPVQTNFFSQDYFNTLNRITPLLKKIPSVLEVNTPLAATTILQINNELKIISFNAALQQGYLQTIEDYKKKLTESVYFGSLISKDYKVITILIKLDTPREDNNYNKRVVLIDNIHKILKAEPLLKDYQLSGETALNYEIDRLSREDLSFLLPIFTLSLIAFLYFIFYNSTKVFLILSIALLTLLSSFSISAILQHPLSGIGVSLPIIIMIILVSDGIHILSKWESLSLTIQDSDLLLKETMKATWFPCLINSLTAAIGFGTFYFNEMIPLKNYSIDAVLSILFAYILIQFLMWAGLDILGYRLDKGLDPAKRNRFLIKFVQSFNTVSYHHYKKILVIAAIVSAIGGYTLYKKAYIETNFLDVFCKKSSETYKAFLFVDKNLNGTGAIDIIFRGTEEDTFKKVENIQKLANLEKEIKKHHLVNNIQSYLDPIRMVHKQFRTDDSELPTTNEQLEQELLFLEFSKSAETNDVLSPYIDFTYQNALMHIQSPNLTNALCNKLTTYISSKLENFSLKTILTGSSIYFETLSGYVLSTQLISLGSGTLFIWLCFIASFGLRLGSIGMIPNMIPILTIYGLIAFLDIPFDYATVIIATVSFGFGVDDSIHFMHNYKHNKVHGLKLEHNLHKTIYDLGQPIMYTHVLFSLAFLTFSFGDMVFLVKVGVFTMVSLSIDLLANLVVLPSVLRILDKDKVTTIS